MTEFFGYKMGKYKLLFIIIKQNIFINVNFKLKSDLLIKF